MDFERVGKEERRKEEGRAIGPLLMMTTLKSLIERDLKALGQFPVHANGFLYPVGGKIACG